jgi:hypothetical protein
MRSSKPYRDVLVAAEMPQHTSDEDYDAVRLTSFRLGASITCHRNAVSACNYPGFRAGTTGIE